MLPPVSQHGVGNGAVSRLWAVLADVLAHCLGLEVEECERCLWVELIGARSEGLEGTTVPEESGLLLPEEVVVVAHHVPLLACVLLHVLESCVESSLGGRELGRGVTVELCDSLAFLEKFEK